MGYLGSWIREFQYWYLCILDSDMLYRCMYLFILNLLQGYFPILLLNYFFSSEIKLVCYHYELANWFLVSKIVAVFFVHSDYQNYEVPFGCCQNCDTNDFIDVKQNS